MAVVGYEWLVIGIIVVVIFIWGPSKLPEVARSFGQARKEFEKASKGLMPDTSGSTPHIENVASDSLVETALRLGIDTHGKTRQEISDEIVWAVQSKK
jgi:sec-independent protein translocase protein TatA